MINKEDRKFKVNTYIILCAYFVIIGIITLMTNGDSIKFSMGDVYPLNDHWEVINIEETNKQLTLPVKFDVKSGHTIRVKRSLPKLFSDCQTIRIRSSMEYVKVLLDNEVVYDNTNDEKLRFPFKSIASMWILIELPPESNGQELEIQLKSNISSMSGRVNEIYFGSKGDLIWQLIESQKISILLSFFVLSVSIFTFIISVFIRIPDTNRIKYLCVFSFSIGLWLLSELDIFQFFSGSMFIVGSISYLILPIASIAIIHYLRVVVLYNYSKPLLILSRFMVGYLLCGIVLQVFFDVHFIRSWIIFIFMLIFMVGLMLVFLINEVIAKNNTAKKYLLFLSVLLISTLVESVMFITGLFMNVSKLSIIGIVVFLLFLLVDSLIDLSKSFQKKGEAKFLREIAYKDVLTGGYNRAAFEKDIDQLLSDNQNQAFRMTMFDLNELKKINDYLGHQVGDQALIEFFKIIKSIYQGDLDKCYRVGGDEFMVIQRDVSDRLHLINLNRFQDEIHKINSHLEYDLSTAIGSDIYYFDKSFGEFKHDVDQKMYENKRHIKLT